MTTFEFLESLTPDLAGHWWLSEGELIALFPPDCGPVQILARELFPLSKEQALDLASKRVAAARASWKQRKTWA